MKKLSIIVPVYNEHKTLRTILDKLINLKLYSNISKEIIIIDDCSTDGSIEIIKSFEIYEFVKTIYKKKNKGKGDSQKIAKNYVSGDFIIIQDADLEYDPEDINKLLKIALNENKEFVIGYRNMKTSISHPYFFFREFAVNLLTFLMNTLYNTSIKDSACCYRLFDKNLWLDIDGNADQFEYDFSIICQAIKKTKNIGQCSVFYESRTYKDGKKCTWDVGLHAFKRIILDRFN
ncbi:glycosyltransferase family 2 protein [Candidatus Pelagibacter sp.]|uniref:glycosyltransferase family 2 protein n=1 Tax=Candidatus Pelagibacter sp. TaxID=2024849 RepID=UPI003F873CAC